MSEITLQGYRHMQARTIALMLRYDEARFRRLIDNRTGSGLQLNYFSNYRDLAVLFQLQASLFEDILPRIIRRLSFESPSTRVIEDLPARGHINWERTLEHNWNDHPGETPLHVHTRMRRRDFATPENLLTIITLLEYRQQALHLLEQERMQVGGDSLRHPLYSIIENCERMLNFPQFAALRNAAQQLLDSGATEQIEAKLAERHNQESSAYSQLLAWREQYRQLQLLENTNHQNEEVVGADPKRDNYLYQLWLFYELIDLLQHKQQLDSFESSTMRLRFRWGQTQTHYELHHDQERTIFWQDAPRVRPDYYIYRVDRTELRDGVQLIWHEPGYILDAKYYLPRGSDSMFSEPRKRMLADLQLIGERYGALLFAYSRDDQSLVDTEQDAHRLPLMQATSTTSFELSQQIRIDGWQIPPQAIENGVARVLHRVLDHVHTTLHQPIAIACHGVIDDIDTIRPGNQRAETCPKCQSVLAFCPKPHVGPQRIDRVCPRCDCLQNKRLCHIIGQDQAFIPPMVQRTLTPEDLTRNIDELKQWLNKQVTSEDSSDHAEQLRTQIFEAIGARVESFAKFSRVDLSSTRNTFRQWIFGEHWETHPNALHQLSREMLVTGEYIWNEVKGVAFDDWAACAVQYLRAFEHEMHRRIYDMCQRKLVKEQYRKLEPMRPQDFTFGSPGGMAKHRHNNAPPFYNQANWQVLREYVAKPNGLDEAAFLTLCLEIDALSKERNRVAHTQRIDRATVEAIRDKVLGKLGQEGQLLALCRQLKV